MGISKNRKLTKICLLTFTYVMADIVVASGIEEVGFNLAHSNHYKIVVLLDLMRRTYPHS